jgi:hypothetical protein
MTIHPHRLWFDSGTPYGSLEMMLHADGINGVWVHFNASGRPEIGFYEKRDALADFEKLRAAKEKNGIDRLPTPSPGETVPPGTVFIGLTETTDGRTYVGRSFPTHSVPPSVTPLFAEAQRIADSALDHPVRVLRGSGAPESPTFVAGEPIRFAVALRSVGAEPVKVANDLVEGAEGSPDWTGVRLVIAPVDPASKKVEPIEAQLEPRNLKVDGAKGRAPRERWLLLAPGEELRVQLGRKLHASPGLYRATAWLVFGGRGDLGALEGTLEIDLGTFEVVRAGKAK